MIELKETSTSTGTGTINLAGAEIGFESFVAGVGSYEQYVLLYFTRWNC